MQKKKAPGKQKRVTRKGYHCTLLEIPEQKWTDLKVALARRFIIATANNQKVPTAFTHWVQEKMDETIEAYK